MNIEFPLPSTLPSAPLVVPALPLPASPKARDERVNENSGGTEGSAATLLSDVFQGAVLRCLNFRRMTVMQSWRQMVAEIGLLSDEGRLPMLAPSYHTLRRHVRSAKAICSGAVREAPSIVNDPSGTDFTSPLHDFRSLNRAPRKRLKP